MRVVKVRKAVRRRAFMAGQDYNPTGMIVASTHGIPCVAVGH
jgi:hypothetical protein